VALIGGAAMWSCFTAVLEDVAGLHGEVIGGAIQCGAFLENLFMTATVRLLPAISPITGRACGKTRLRTVAGGAGECPQRGKTGSNRLQRRPSAKAVTCHSQSVRARARPFPGCRICNSLANPRVTPYSKAKDLKSI